MTAAEGEEQVHKLQAEISDTSEGRHAETKSINKSRVSIMLNILSRVRLTNRAQIIHTTHY